MGSMVGAGRQNGQSNGQSDWRAAAPVPAAPPARFESAARSQASGGLRVGQSVFHTKFGEGVIVTLEGVGDDARAQVNFGRHGVKWLALSIAKLTPID